jgi:hypothetical protein
MNETQEYKYTLNTEKEDIINIYAKELILQWCESNHPNIIQQAKKIAEDYLHENV